MDLTIVGYGIIFKVFATCRILFLNATAKGLKQSLLWGVHQRRLGHGFKPRKRMFLLAQPAATLDVWDPGVALNLSHCKFHSLESLYAQKPDSGLTYFN